MDNLIKVDFDIPQPANIIAYYKILGLVQALGMDERLAEVFAETVAAHCSTTDVVHMCCSIHKPSEAYQLLIEGDCWQEKADFFYLIMMPMTWWVLETAMKQCAVWHQDGLPVCIDKYICQFFTKRACGGAGGGV